jgi:23S rRNA (uracil1939-C5)-methyltransferase
MQFPYVKQLHDKAKETRAALARFLPKEKARTPEDDPLSPVTASPAELGYRTSTKLCLSEDDFGRRSVGLYERGTKTVVAIPACPVHHPAVNALVLRLVGERARLPAPFYRHAKRGFQAGKLKFLTVRYCPETDAFGVVVSHTGVAREDLARWAVEVAQPNVSIYEAMLVKEDDDLILTEKATHLAGPPDLPFTVGGRTFRLSPLAFFQANFALNDRFVEHVTAGAEGDTLLDLYGGFGAYGLHAAAHFKKVHLVDANAHAIQAAQRAAAAFGIKTAVASRDPVEVFLDRRLNADERRAVTHAIVNPPRGGLSAKVRDQLASDRLPNLQSLTYVSCNLETLRRDLVHLTAGGRYEVRSVVPFDMFPQTDHLELVVKLVRKPTAGRRGPRRPGRGTNLGRSSSVRRPASFKKGRRGRN